jgi:hypothetical protein
MNNGEPEGLAVHPAMLDDVPAIYGERCKRPEITKVDGVPRYASGSQLRTGLVS